MDKMLDNLSDPYIATRFAVAVLVVVLIILVVNIGLKKIIATRPRIYSLITLLYFLSAALYQFVGRLKRKKDLLESINSGEFEKKNPLDNLAFVLGDIASTATFQYALFIGFLIIPLIGCVFGILLYKDRELRQQHFQGVVLSIVTAIVFVFLWIAS